MKVGEPLPRLALSDKRPFEHVVILGSGASAAVTEDSTNPFPTDPNILQRLKHHRYDYYLQPLIIEMALRYLQGDGNDWVDRSFEEVWSLIDDSYNAVHPPLPRKIRSEFARLRAEAAHRERENGVRCYYSVREGNPTSTELLVNAGWECLQAILALLGHLPEGTDLDRFFRRLPHLRDTPSAFAVISFNYDLAFETACNDASICFINYPVAVDYDKGEGIVLLKPHGSVNWVQRIDAAKGTTISIDSQNVALPLDETGYEAPRKKHLTQPMVVGLRPKHEHDERSRDRLPVDLFRAIREACVTVLANAKEVSIIGYRFPPADRYFRNVLMDAWAARERPLARVRYIGKGGDESNWKGIISHLFWLRSHTDISVDLRGF